MAKAATCPACGEENSSYRKFDARACYEIIGLGEDGEILLSDDCDTQVFDDHHIECSSCDKQFDEGEIIRHLDSSEETGEEE